MGSLLIITGLIHVGRGDILAAALNFVDFSNTYLVTPGQRIAFLLTAQAPASGPPPLLFAHAHVRTFCDRIVMRVLEGDKAGASL